jgi:hypothetical protein
VPAPRIVYDRDHLGVSSIRGDEVEPFALAMTDIAVAMIRIWALRCGNRRNRNGEKAMAAFSATIPAPAFHFLPPLDLDQWRRPAGVLRESRHVK